MGKQKDAPFGKRLRELRKKAGLTQEELGTRSGLSISNLAQIEQGQRSDPRISTLLALANGLQVRPCELLSFAAGASND